MPAPMDRHSVCSSPQMIWWLLHEVLFQLLIHKKEGKKERRKKEKKREKKKKRRKRRKWTKEEEWKKSTFEAIDNDGQEFHFLKGPMNPHGQSSQSQSSCPSCPSYHPSLRRGMQWWRRRGRRVEEGGRGGRGRRDGRVGGRERGEGKRVKLANLGFEDGNESIVISQFLLQGRTQTLIILLIINKWTI